jgi:hypothetical protein
LGVPSYQYDALLPPTTCAFLGGWTEPPKIDIGRAIAKHGGDFGIEPGFVWGSLLPGGDAFMLAGTRVRGADCSNSDDLTHAEIDGRRQVRAIMDLLRARYPESELRLIDFPASIGIRDSRHFRCQYQLAGKDILEGKRFPDAIANGSYRVDIHHQDRPGITFLYLDGRRQYIQQGHACPTDRWRDPIEKDPTFYQVPLRSLVPTDYDNLILAGRMLDADKTAFSAVRVMVNTNQMGEAAGVAAFLAFSNNAPVQDVQAIEVRRLLAEGGSIVI